MCAQLWEEGGGLRSHLTEGEHAGVNTRIKDAWEASWRQGKFSVSRSTATSFIVVWESCSS